MYSKNIGQTIRNLRKNKGWSLSFLAGKLDISIPALSKIETGITDPNLSRIDQLANIFGTSVVCLLNDGALPVNVSELDLRRSKLDDRERYLTDLKVTLTELSEELEKKYPEK